MTTDHMNVKGASRKCFHGYLAKGINWICFKPILNLHLRRLKKTSRKNLIKCLGEGKSVLACKPRKKLGGKLKDINLDCDVNVVSTCESFGKEIASFYKASLGLDESTVIAAWDKVDDGPKKRGLEEKWKKIKAMDMELCLQRIELVADVANVIYKEYASSELVTF
ncbi:PREDICTED: probable transcription factor At4g01260 [Camelina sativa]|uniref:Probable transcription factor At4g01260 n=1 Tax=Camelina sativa TaxID=90675 RepID=A0ABM1RP45_CAMSA|nr:PREDICTED: probable transcription factor At4g01260 [Camelina sativa]